ncbi:hypothetical protein CDD81_4086 [Ophiocordyceps australis]|uniref:Uncharacterized protein n=1 Tax=Ophiocordyceps australis TaxID=1399860 RepID=A0A2C5Y577_9HYPO|nr:hypothetical protein CDD81_4086 [Ophiocordyceps australis]
MNISATSIRMEQGPRANSKRRKHTKKYAQELLSTFPTLGEVALQPGGSGTFTMTLTTSHDAPGPSPDSCESSAAADVEPLACAATPQTRTTVLWDRRRDSGFPETKTLKRLVRDVIEPSRTLGHIDGLPSAPPPECLDC